MKIKVEIDITPEEVQELFIPGEKQQEFFTKLGEIYTKATVDAATKILNLPLGSWI